MWGMTWCALCTYGWISGLCVRVCMWVGVRVYEGICRCGDVDVFAHVCEGSACVCDDYVVVWQF